MSHYIDKYGNIYLPEYTIRDYRASLMSDLTMVNSEEGKNKQTNKKTHLNSVFLFFIIQL